MTGYNTTRFGVKQREIDQSTNQTTNQSINQSINQLLFQRDDTVQIQLSKLVMV